MYSPSIEQTGADRSAKTLKDRTHQYQQRSTVIPGQGYSTIAWLPDSGGSWALPIRHERITSWESPISKAVWQIKQVLKHLQHRALVLLDREYGNAKWVLATANLEIECVMRIRSNTCLWTAPPPYSGRGCPRKHGQKFQLKQPETWTIPAQVLELSESICGRVKVTMWQGLHSYPAPQHSVSLILVERLDATGNGRLMPLMTWQLWLARDLVTEFRLPWQSASMKLSPGRVAQSMFSLLLDLGTPARIPKSRGKSSGRALGFTPTPRIRYPIAKKGISRPQSRPKTG